MPVYKSDGVDGVNHFPKKFVRLNTQVAASTSTTFLTKIGNFHPTSPPKFKAHFKVLDSCKVSLRPRTRPKRDQDCSSEPLGSKQKSTSTPGEGPRSIPDEILATSELIPPARGVGGRTPHLRICTPRFWGSLLERS